MRRNLNPQWVVLHETAGTCFDARKVAERLAKKGMGVHFIIDPWGKVFDSVSLGLWCVHANQCNARSVGIELINPYYPARLKEPFSRLAPAQWWTHCRKGAPRGYVLPTTWQMAALFDLLPKVCAATGVPLAFPTVDGPEALSAEKPRILGWRDRATPPPGIVAHRDFATHSDGRWPLEQCAAHFGAMEKTK